MDPSVDRDSEQEARDCTRATLLRPFMAVPAVEPKTMDYEEWRGQVRSLCGRYSPATDGAPSGSASFVARHWISRARGFTPGVPRATARWSLAGAVSNYTHSVPQTGTSGTSGRLGACDAGS